MQAPLPPQINGGTPPSSYLPPTIITQIRVGRLDGHWSCNILGINKRGIFSSVLISCLLLTAHYNLSLLSFRPSLSSAKPGFLHCPFLIFSFRNSHFLGSFFLSDCTLSCHYEYLFQFGFSLPFVFLILKPRKFTTGRVFQVEFAGFSTSVFWCSILW